MKKGFTLIELVLVITILGILAVSALPRFIDVSTRAEQASMAGVVGAVRAGIALQRADDLVTNGPPGVYPATLDAVAVSTPCSSTNPCFGTVLANGVTDGSWATGAAARTYAFSDGTTTYAYAYDNGAGTFVSTTAGAP